MKNKIPTIIDITEKEVSNILSHISYCYYTSINLDLIVDVKSKIVDIFNFKRSILHIPGKSYTYLYLTMSLCLKKISKLIKDPELLWLIERTLLFTFISFEEVESELFINLSKLIRDNQSYETILNCVLFYILQFEETKI